MGMPAPATKEWTYEMLETLPDDGNRFEIIDGELLVSQAPTWSHQGVLWDRGRDYRSAKRGRAGYFRHPARCRPEIRIVEGHQILTPCGRDPFSVHCARGSTPEALAVSTVQRERVLDRRLGRASDRSLAARGCPRRNIVRAHRVATGHRSSATANRSRAILRPRSRRDRLVAHWHLCMWSVRVSSAGHPHLPFGIATARASKVIAEHVTLPRTRPASLGALSRNDSGMGKARR
jgi:hypothetical protein